MHSADYAVASCLTVSPSHAGILSERLNILSDFFTVGHHSSFLYQKRYSNTSTEIPLTTASNAGVRKKRFSANIFSSVHYTVFFISAVHWDLSSSKRKPGRPWKNWIDTIQQELKSIGMTCEVAQHLAVIREGWRRCVAECVFDTGWTKV